MDAFLRVDRRRYTLKVCHTVLLGKFYLNFPFKTITM